MSRLRRRRERDRQPAAAVKDALHQRPSDDAPALESAPADPACDRVRAPVLAGGIFLQGRVQGAAAGRARHGLSGRRVDDRDLSAQRLHRADRAPRREAVLPLRGCAAVADPVRQVYGVHLALRGLGSDPEADPPPAGDGERAARRHGTDRRHRLADARRYRAGPQR